MGLADIASPTVATDAQLVERAGLGDEVAFGQLVEGRIDRAFRTASAILGNEADARDATQDAFTSAWVNLPRLRDVDRFDAWLNRILMNRCRDLLRSRRRSREIAIDEASLPQVLTTQGALDISALTAAFERLDIAQRQLLVLHHLHHEPLAQIARRLGIPLGTAKSRLHAARKALERALEKER
ncbi:MAG TPA: RNA polymerase sigma factor [Candidatus Limnocylindria bacterium]